MTAVALPMQDAKVRWSIDVTRIVSKRTRTTTGLPPEARDTIGSSRSELFAISAN